MRWQIVLLFGAAFSIPQVLASLPPKEDLCEIIVDAKVEQECLRCFTEAGLISEHPEKVRKCVATYLPPDLAECSVPHAEGPNIVRIQQGGGNHHHNHTNANFIPVCLKRRLRRLHTYIKKEDRFFSQASSGVEYIVKSKLVKHGGPTILSVNAMNAIVQYVDNKGMMQESVAYCEDKFSSNELYYWERDLREETYDSILEDLMKEEEEEKIEEGDKMVGGTEENNGLMKTPVRRPSRNNLPYGGTNMLARVVMLQKCIVTSLMERGEGPDLLELIMQENFYDPIPAWLVRPLLTVAKNGAGEQE
ncbi:uncharacterized protein LOC123505645 isoform X2 [Portunus trituberculatus]|uniref:uncharacterized protein LOC123505645 isoform X2 n=1 Tax=Portunus trituberculatus TaxID=210409 RepID=UPI001E1CF2E3|nr:uncharacterized protein LOC123505645 isoform X2 [Portunus trituberculatus]